MVYLKSNPEQTFLLPTDLRTIIAEDHICHLIEEIVDQLDFTKYDEAVDGAGHPSYHPRINLKIILNGICDRVTSSRVLERQAHENVVYMQLAENMHPDFHTIARFRKENVGLIKQCFLQTIEVAKALEMTNFNKLYLDGMKIKANASKNKNFSKEEIKFLAEFVETHLSKMDEADEEVDEEPKIPEHLTHRRKLKDRIKEILKNPVGCAGKLDKAKKKINEEGVDKVNFTDGDSKLMKMKQGRSFAQAYNCQLLVEDKVGIIVGNHVSDCSSDMNESIPTLEKFKEEQGESLEKKEVFEDNGYLSSKNAEYFEDEGAVAYVPDKATTRELHGKEEVSRFHLDNFELDFEKNQVVCPEGCRMDFARRDVRGENWGNIYRTKKCKNCAFRVECAGDKKGHVYREARVNPLLRRIRLRMKTKEGREKYAKRFHKGEVAQAHIEHNLGYREFRCRGLKSCENEVNLFSIGYNLKKIWIEKRKRNGGFVVIWVFELVVVWRGVLIEL